MKIAMIGAGGIAGRHMSALQREPEVELVGSVTRTARTREAFAKRWGGRAYPDTESLLKGEEVDAAWICVPPGAHDTIEAQLIARRIPFMVEKPLSADRKTAETIAESLEQTGVLAGVAYHFRAMDTIPQIADTLKTSPARMVHGIWHGSTPPPAWWHKQATSGGQIVEQATHLVDMARHLVGEGQVKSASGFHHSRPQFPDLDVADVSAALVDFPNDTLGIFSATCVLERSSGINLQLMCDGLSITITQQQVVYQTGKEERIVRVTNDPFQAENHAFIQAIKQNDPSLLYCSYNDALKTHHLCHDMLDMSQA